MKRLLATILLAALLLSPLPTRGASSPIKSIDVSPKGFVTHLDELTVRVRLNDTDSSRILILILDCTSKYDEGRIELLPKEQPPARVYRNISGGECTAIAYLFYKDGDEPKQARKEGPKVYVMALEPLP